jgi:putative transposase
MTHRDHKRPVTQQAKLFKVIQASVYPQPKSVNAAYLALMRRIDELHLKHPFMSVACLG